MKLITQCKKAWKAVYFIMGTLKKGYSMKNLGYTSMIRPILEQVAGCWYLKQRTDKRV